MVLHVDNYPYVVARCIRVLTEPLRVGCDF